MAKFLYLILVVLLITIGDVEAGRQRRKRQNDERDITA